MVQVKGTLIAGKRQYVLKNHGEDKLHKVLAQLKDQGAASRLKSTVLKSAWYPFELFIDMTQAIDRVVGYGDGRLYRSIAAYTAEDDLSSVYKVYLRNQQPMYIVNKAAQLWSLVYTSGQLLASETSSSAIELEVVNFESPNWVHCESVLGWAERGIQLSGVKGVRADHLECRSRGAGRCRMSISWTAS